MRTPLPNTNTGRLLFHGGGRQGFNILVAPVGSTSFTLTEDDIYNGGFLYNAASTSSQTIELGSVFASQLCLSVIDYDNTYTGINLAGARLTVTIKASDGTTSYTVPFGQFTVDEVKRSTNRIDLIALDDFIKFDKTYTDTDYPFVEPTSLYDVIEWICSECGVTFGTLEADLTNADYIVKTAPKGTNLTYRQLLSWAAQLTGSCAKFNASTNELEFVWYGQGGSYSVSTDDTFEHNVSSNEILITGILVKQYGKERYTTPNNYYPLTIEDNGLLTIDDDDFITAINEIFDKTVGTSYFPIALTKINDPLIEPFDRIEYTSADGDVFYSYATNVNYAFSDYTGIESVGMSEENKSYADGSPFTTEQQAIVGGLQGKLILKKNVYRSDYLIKDAILSDNGLGMINNASWYYSTDMSKILSSTISGTYTVEITASDYTFKLKTLYSTSTKSFIFFVDFNNISTISNYVSQSPASRQAIGTKATLVPLGGSATSILIKIDTINNNWSVVSRKSINGAKLSIYKSTPTELIEYVEDDTLDFDVEPTEDSENFISSGSVYDSLKSKQDALIFDYEPTDGSENPVTSDGIYQSLQAKQDTIFVRPEQFGAKGNGVADDTNAFVQMFDALSNNSIVVCNGKYKITSEIEILDKANITILSGNSEFYVPPVESAEAHTLFLIKDCENVTFSGGCFRSARTATENSISTGSVSRQTNTGSNITFFSFARCTNMRFESQVFENSKFDIRSVEEASQSGISYDIVISNMISSNASVSINIAAIDRCLINNVDIAIAERLSLAEHSIYLSKKCTNVTIDNFVIKQDGYCGSALQVNSADDSKEILIGNGIIEALEGITVTRSECNIDNIIFNGISYGIDTLASGGHLSKYDEFFLRTYKDAKVTVNNSKIKCLEQNVKTQFSQVDDVGSSKAVFTNCDIDCDEYNLRTIYTQASDSSDDIAFDVKFKNCRIKTNLLMYIADKNAITAEFDNCDIICNTKATYNYALSIRDVRSLLTIRHSNIKIGNSESHSNPNIIYYNNLSETEKLDCFVRFCFVDILDYDNVTYNTALKTNRVLIQTYLNDSLQT